MRSGNSRFAPTGRFGLAWLLGLSLTASLLYMIAWAFYGLTSFDDEGTLMMTFRDLNEGSRLYDDTYALYGPFYYLTVGALFTVLHLPLTHDVIRLASLGFWAVCTVTFAAVAYLLTRSRIVTVIAFVLALPDLRYFPRSPTHPEELCLILLGLLPFLLHRIERGALWIQPAAIGAMVAALLLVKINIGIFVAAALTLTLLRVSGRRTWLLLVFTAAAMASLLLPTLLMWPLLAFSWVVNYCAFATMTILSAILVWSRTQPPVLLTIRHWLIAFSAAAVTAIATISVVLAGGTSAYAMLNAVVLQPGHLIRNWYMPTWFGDWGALAMLAGTGSALAYVWFDARPTSRDIARQIASWAKIVVGVVGISLVCGFSATQTGDPAVIIFRLLEPFCWLLLVPPFSGRPGLPVTRAGIGLLAAFMVLYPFPVAGSQTNDAVLILTMMLPVLVHDAVADLPAITAVARRLLVSPRGAGIASCCIVVGAVLVIPTIYAVWDYWSGVAPGLPGTRLIRVNAETAASHHWAMRQLSKCGSFYTLPGQLSYYFWLGKPSPTKLNNNDTLGLLTYAQQEQVASELSIHPDLCVLKVPSLQTKFDRGQVAMHPPLLRYIDGNFAPVATDGQYQLLKHRPSRGHL